MEICFVCILADSLLRTFMASLGYLILAVREFQTGRVGCNPAEAEPFLDEVSEEVECSILLQNLKYEISKSFSVINLKDKCYFEEEKECESVSHSFSNKLFMGTHQSCDFIIIHGLCFAKVAIKSSIRALLRLF